MAFLSCFFHSSQYIWNHFSSLLLQHNCLKEIFCYLAVTSKLTSLEISEVSFSDHLQLSVLSYCPVQWNPLALTNGRRGEIKNKDAYLQFTGNLNHKRKNTNLKDYIIAKNYCWSNSAHNNQRTAKLEEPLHMQLFKMKSESVSFLNMTTQKGDIVRLPWSYCYFDTRKGWKCI